MRSTIVSLVIYAGADDDLVLPSWGRDTASKLLLGGANVQFVEVQDTAHEIGEEEVEPYMLIN